MPELKLYISPCPNDTFMFDAWINKRTEIFSEFEVKAEFFDIKTINNLAEQEIPDITKLSVYTAAKILDKYQFLTSGAAIGFGNGPLIISKKKINPSELIHTKIGVPGYNTTAYALLKLFFPNANNVKDYFFYEIEDALLDEEIDVGIIIHETRFTFEKKGLVKIADLGQMWEKTYNLPLPLGIIAVKRSISTEFKRKINELLKQSILYAFKNNSVITDFVLRNAQINDINIVKEHIRLYVNEMSIELNDTGKTSIVKFINEITRIGLINRKLFESDLFVK